MTDPIRAADYVRVSSARQAKDGLSLPEQQRRTAAHIAAQDGWLHVETYVEPAVSGKVPFDQRPEFRKLLANLDSIDRLVIPKLDRLGRNLRDLLDVFQRLEAADVAVVSLTESIDTSTSTGRMMLNLLGVFAEFERERLSERVSDVTEARARDGKWHGGPPPYGYDYDRDEHGKPTGKGLIVVEAEAVVMRRIFSEYVAGRSQRQIARDLIADGIKPKTAPKWSQGTISKLLTSPVYIGVTHLKGTTYDSGKHEAIVDEDTWRKAEQLREASTRSNGGRGRTPRANHVLAGGLLRCGRCGSAMSAVTKETRKPGVLYEVYACSGRMQYGPDYCDQPPVKRPPIDQGLWRFFEKVALDVDATQEALAEHHTAMLAEIDGLRGPADREAHKIADALVRIERDYRDGKLTAEQWSRLDANMTAELAGAEAQVARLDQQREVLANEMEQVDTEAAVLEQLAELRATIVGEVREGSREGVEAFRAALTRLFEPFVLLTAVRHEGRLEVLGDEPDTRPGWYGFRIPDDLWLEEDADGTRYVLSPVVRTDAVTSMPTAATEFPALKKAALALSGTDANSFTT
jgi:site-specific DNA recombinase